MQLFQFYINPQNLIHTPLYPESKIYYYYYYYLLLYLYVIIFCLSDLAVTLINYCFFYRVTGENFLLHPPLHLLHVITCPSFYVLQNVV